MKILYSITYHTPRPGKHVSYVLPPSWGESAYEIANGSQLETARNCAAPHISSATEKTQNVTEVVWTRTSDMPGMQTITRSGLSLCWEPRVQEAKKL
jgi:hypothetical protein